MKYTMPALMAVLIAVLAPSVVIAASETTAAGETTAGETTAGETPASGGAITEGPITFGIVDVKRVVDECEYRKLYESRIEELLQRKRLESVDLKQEVDKKIGDLQREQFLRSDEAKEGIQKEIDAQEQRLRDFAIEAKKAVEEENRKYSDELESKVKAIVGAVAEERGVDIVLNSMAVLYKSGVIDLTDLVLARLNEEYRKEHGGTAAGGTDAGKGGAETKGN